MINYEYELSFLLDVLKKCHVGASILSNKDSAEQMLEPHFLAISGIKLNSTVGQLLGVLDAKTKYKYSNELRFQYVCLRLPVASESNILVIGPYLSSPPSSRDILEIAERVGIPIAAQRSLKEYYSSLSVIPDGDRIFTVIDSFCEHIWKTSSFAIVELDSAQNPYAFHLEGSSRGENYDEIEANIKMMELRYSLENELMRTVSRGQQHKVSLLISKLGSAGLFERRVADPLRNAKNYCIIMNTLLRKAAEEGGVHPIYIDKMSSKFAVKIELLPSVKECTELMGEMFSSYCRLVYKHSTRSLSPIVQKTVLVIDSDISAALSLSTLAKDQGVSAGYLSTAFKREMGKTVMEYIRDKRMEYAMHLLGTTSLQIQTVALHCGIMDVQHFSKIFKKKTGKNPREYREAFRAR